jgi:hypothetical protein
MSARDRTTGPSPADEVKRRFEEAADTLRALRLTARDRPSARLARWPDVVHQAILAYGWSATRVRPPAPPPDAIDRLDETLGWLWPLADDERRLVMARAFRLPWRRIEDMDGRSERTLRNVHARVLKEIAARPASKGRSSIDGTNAGENRS